MEIFNSFLNVIGAIVIATGAVFIYDARLLSKKCFPSNNINDATRKLKLIGFGFCLIGGIVFLL